MKRVILGSVSQMVSILQQYKDLQRLPVFQNLAPLITQLSKQGGCGCDKNALISSYRQSFEASLKNLTSESKTSVKRILNADSVCYYVRSDRGDIELKCF